VFIADPAKLTPAQMDRWCRDFDNWAVCDTACFHAFDRTPHAWGRVKAWSRRRDEFEKRAAFALLASLALHDRTAGDERFLALMPLIERAAVDDRNFVKKGVSWALRSIGHRSQALHEAATALARRLTAADDTAARWTGHDTLRDLQRPLVARRVARRAARGGTARAGRA
jgi:3-methyladenine DNA glycosylase AlkD